MIQQTYCLRVACGTKGKKIFIYRYRSPVTDKIIQIKIGGYRRSPLPNLYGDAVKVLGDLSARDITRKIVVNMIMAIVARGTNIQVDNVLRELSSAYEYAIGLEKFDDDFANPALQAKSSLKQAKVKLTSKKRRRFLSDAEPVQVLKWLLGPEFSQIF